MFFGMQSPLEHVASSRAHAVGGRVGGSWSENVQKVGINYLIMELVAGTYEQYKHQSTEKGVNKVISKTVGNPQIVKNT